MTVEDGMKCWIYRSASRDETYLYLPGEEETQKVPDELLQRLGRLELVMELTLSRERSLARADPVEVMRCLLERGFYLQLPPINEPEAGQPQ